MMARMIMQNFETGKGHEVQCVSIAEALEALEAVGATFTAEPVKPSYHAHSKALLTESHASATETLGKKLRQRDRLIEQLVNLDRQIVHLTNRRSDLATGIDWSTVWRGPATPPPYRPPTSETPPPYNPPAPAPARPMPPDAPR